MVRILLADSDATTREAVQALAGRRGYDVTATADGLRALRLASEEEVDLVIAEQQLAGRSGLELLTDLGRITPGLPIVILSAFGSVEDAVAAMRLGASDCLSKPLAGPELELAIDRALEQSRLRHENITLREALDDRLRLDNLIATDAKMQAVFKTVKAVARARTTVLITGESGTGKTLLARAIHGASDRAQGPFVEVNCGAMPETLLESELFGHVKGAFTGAVRDKEGKFEAAILGTIFLDEIGTSSPGFQVKLLRVLQERVIERVGDTKTIPVDVRVILATNQDLKEEVRQKRFREDLYYRIHVVALHMPPLRERRGDVPFLAEHFLKRFAAENKKPIHGFTRPAMDRLVAASWPGNVRQLENVVERAVVLSEGREIDISDLPPDLHGESASTATTAVMVATELRSEAPEPLKEALDRHERDLIERALAHHKGNRQVTALALGIDRSTLFNKMRKFNLS